MLGVRLLVILPFLGKIVGGKDGRDRADGHTCPAVDAFNRIDKDLIQFRELRLILFGMNAIYRAGVDSGGILGADAGFCNYISHKTFGFSLRDFADNLIVTNARGANLQNGNTIEVRFASSPNFRL